MLGRRTRVKEYLKKFKTKEVKSILEESNLTPRQKVIAEMRLIKYSTYVSISLKLNFSESSIKKDMEKVYDKIYNLFVM